MLNLKKISLLAVVLFISANFLVGCGGGSSTTGGNLGGLVYNTTPGDSITGDMSGEGISGGSFSSAAALFIAGAPAAVEVCDYSVDPGSNFDTGYITGSYTMSSKALPDINGSGTYTCTPTENGQPYVVRSHGLEVKPPIYVKVMFSDGFKTSGVVSNGTLSISANFNSSTGKAVNMTISVYPKVESNSWSQGGSTTTSQPYWY